MNILDISVCYSLQTNAWKTVITCHRRTDPSCYDYSARTIKRSYLIINETNSTNRVTMLRELIKQLQSNIPNSTKLIIPTSRKNTLTTSRNTKNFRLMQLYSLSRHDVFCQYSRASLVIDSQN